jgi:thymidine kinase
MKTENGSQLDLVLGTMFSGKTTYILSQIAKMAELNYSILYINIEFDNRSETIFSTHNPFFDTHKDFIKKESIKNNVEMIKVKKLFDTTINIDAKDVIIIDESHFFDDLVDFVNKCLDANKYVIVAGLIADFKGNKFGKTLDLIPICSNIKRLHAYCAECAKDKKCCIATYSKRIVKCKKSIDIGGSEKYIPVCRHHFNSIEQLQSQTHTQTEKTEKISKNKSKVLNKIEKETELSDENSDKYESVEINIKKMDITTD